MDLSSSEFGNRQWHRVRFDANARQSQGRSLATAGDDFIISHRRMQQGVIDHNGNRGTG